MYCEGQSEATAGVLCGIPADSSVDADTSLSKIITDYYNGLFPRTRTGIKKSIQCTDLQPQ